MKSEVQMSDKPKFLEFAMNHVKSMMSPGLYVVHEALTFGIYLTLDLFAFFCFPNDLLQTI
jgi:hypothetical protein